MLQALKVGPRGVTGFGNKLNRATFDVRVYRYPIGTPRIPSV